MSNAYLSRTTGTPTQQNTWTWSAWVKFSNANPAGDRDGTLLSEYYNVGTYTTYERINFSRLRYETGVAGSGSFITNRSFDDTNAFYHIVIVNDWSNSTTADRIKLYVNGVRETSFASFTAPSSGSSRINGDSEALRIGAKNGSLFFDGIMSHVHFIDGTAYDASAFGETDATTGEWKIKTSPSVTYGNNGFFILKDGNSVTDQSGEGNDFTAVNSLTKTEDSPSNVFNTMNPLNIDSANTETNFGAGNTMLLPTADAAYNYGMSTIAMSKGNGKYYFEMKYYPWDYVETAVGIVNMDYASDIFYQNRQIITAANNTEIGRVLVTSDGHAITSGTANSSYGFGGWSAGDIICMACDMENGAFYFRKNGGSWANSGDPTSGATKTGAIDISSTSAWTESSHWGIWCGDNSTGGSNRLSFNFGNGNFPYIVSGGGASATFGANAVGDAGTNASGNGIFEEDVPTGYTALSTKGLNL